MIQSRLSFVLPVTGHTISIMSNNEEDQIYSMGSMIRPSFHNDNDEHVPTATLSSPYILDISSSPRFAAHASPCHGKPFQRDALSPVSSQKSMISPPQSVRNSRIKFMDNSNQNEEDSTESIRRQINNIINRRRDESPSFARAESPRLSSPSMNSKSSTALSLPPGVAHSGEIPKLVVNTKTSEKEIQVVQEAMADGFLKYGLPISAAAVTGTFLMRRRHRQLKTTPIESFLLSALHYYGALSLGLYAGMTLYAPQFEATVLEKIPDSAIAHAIKEGRKTLNKK